MSGIFVQHQAYALRDAGLKVGIISAGLIPWNKVFTSFPYNEYEIDQGIPVYRYFVKKMLPGRVLVRLGLGRLLAEHEALYMKYIEENGVPDIIHAHNSLYAGVVACHLKSKFNVPVVVTEHGSEYGRKLLNGIQLKESLRVQKEANCRIVVSKAQRGWLHSALGIDENLMIVIPNLVQPFFEQKQVSESVCNIEKEKFVYLSIGCLDENKNHSGLLEAFADAFKGESNVCLRVIGDGPQRDYLVRKAAKSGVSDQVSFLGELGRKDVEKEIRNCSALVHPSKFETFGVVLIEALAFGKPVISTSCGGPQDIVNDENGILVPVGDIERLSIAMKEIISNYQKYSSDKIQNNCKYKFGSEVVVKKIISCYRSVLGSK